MTPRSAALLSLSRPRVSAESCARAFLDLLDVFPHLRRPSTTMTADSSYLVVHVHEATQGDVEAWAAAVDGVPHVVHTATGVGEVRVRGDFADIPVHVHLWADRRRAVAA